MPQTAPRNGRPARERPRKPPETLGTWVLDSVGDRKYAIQVRKAGNGNPCLRLVEGLPQDDGTYRKFNVTIWSEDFARFFELVDAVRAFIDANGVKTPEGHKYVPRSQRERRSGPGRNGRPQDALHRAVVRADTPNAMGR